MNKVNFKKVLDKIKKDPDSWNQRSWHCETSHCIAGHCQLMIGNVAKDKTVRVDARTFLEIGSRQSDYLFDGSRTIIDFEHVLENGFNERFNDVGFIFDIDGYDEEGLDKNNKPRKK